MIEYSVGPPAAPDCIWIGRLESTLRFDERREGSCASVCVREREKDDERVCVATSGAPRCPGEVEEIEEVVGDAPLKPLAPLIIKPPACNAVAPYPSRWGWGFTVPMPIGGSKRHPNAAFLKPLIVKPDEPVRSRTLQAC